MPTKDSHPVKYEVMKERVTAYATVPNGYNGAFATVGLAWVDGILFEVADCGYYHGPWTDEGRNMRYLNIRLSP